MPLNHFTHANNVLLLIPQVTDQCTVRMPNSFLVSVTTANGVIITTDNHPHSESVATTIHILLSVDECDLIVRISAENRAGVSSPTDIPVGKLSTKSTNKITEQSLPLYISRFVSVNTVRVHISM